MWHYATNANVCVVQYPYLDRDYYSMLKNIRSTIKKRFNIVAEQTCDFISKLLEDKIINSLDDVVMSGFCFGGHIAAYTCRILDKKFNQKIKALFGELH